MITLWLRDILCLFFFFLNSGINWPFKELMPEKEKSTYFLPQLCVWKLHCMNGNESLQLTALVYLMSRSNGDNDHNLWRCKMRSKCLAYQWFVPIRYLWGWQSCLCVCLVVCYHELKVLLQWPLTQITGGCCLKQVRRYIPLTVRW